MDNLKETLSCYVAFLRALYLVHQNNHWIAKGDDFYGNHQLFQRLYESAQENADLAAEKVVGLFGEDYLVLDGQTKMLNKILSLSYPSDPVECSLAFEKRFLVLSKKVYNMLKESGQMTLGLDDMIMSIASSREEAVYLLQQTLKK